LAIGEEISLDVGAPLIEAVHLMVKHHLINLPIMKQDKVVGILREQDITLEVARSMR